MNAEHLIGVGIFLVLIGFVLLVAGGLWQAAGSGNGNGSVRGGGVIFIGPIPIVFGSDKGMALFSLAIGIAIVALYFLFFQR